MLPRLSDLVRHPGAERYAVRFRVVILEQDHGALSHGLALVIVVADVNQSIRPDVADVCSEGLVQVIVYAASSPE